MSEQNVQTPVVEQDLNEIFQIRRDKLAKLHIIHKNKAANLNQVRQNSFQ